MSPHAVLPDHGQRSNGRNVSEANGRHSSASKSSLLQRYHDDELHDVVCIGFGPASLAIAVALHDALETGETALKSESPKVRFLERQEAFAWHAGMLLPGTKMQITFVKDLATMRNPRSSFTFLNYLHTNGRLAAFTNLGTFLPQRIEYEDYLRWSANHFDNVVDYDRDVQSVNIATRNSQTHEIESFVIRSFDKSTGQQSCIRTKHVVIAAGGRPSLPKVLPAKHPRILHSSQYNTNVDSIFENGRHPRSVAVIGAGQSAAEVFHNIPSRFPHAKAHLLIRGSALRPSDDSPFVNEIFDPDKVDEFFGREADLRARTIALDKATNYGVVRLELLDELYAELYSQSIRIPDEQDRPLKILNHRNVVGAEDITEDGEARLRLHIKNETSRYTTDKVATDETLDVDLVIVASGYVRNAHTEMLKDLKRYMPEGSQDWAVNRDYSVQFKEGAVMSDAGIWLQGCNENSHGLSDTLLSVLANRGGEMVASILGAKKH
ncbi:hypothetical protein AMS68_000673 [Peltaster fructicola]|uniref:L-ornithine N(5)-monooxygenase [NAD(P)H] n=1 Tax=Peltaster fructicola TaxID=286661 RepID=A0A6H0XKC7_9PEZI|nr:hypothetical protein AMS68_000673 [Peltaster fructicola]